MEIFLHSLVLWTPLRMYVIQAVFSCNRFFCYEFCICSILCNMNTKGTMLWCSYLSSFHFCVPLSFGFPFFSSLFKKLVRLLKTSWSFCYVFCQSIPNLNPCLETQIKKQVAQSISYSCTNQLARNARPWDYIHSDIEQLSFVSVTRYFW